MPPTLPNVAVNDVVEARLNYTLFDQHLMTVLHYECFSAGPVPEDWWTAYLGIAGEMGDATTGLIPKTLAVMSEEVTLDYIDLQVVRPQRLIYRRFGNTNSGDLVGSPPPSANVAMSITKKSEIAAKGNSGRVQLFGLQASQMANGKWSPAILDTVSTQLIGYYLGNITISGAAFQPVIIGKSKTGVLKQSTVVDMVPQQTVRTMHRRTVGRGI